LLSDLVSDLVRACSVRDKDESYRLAVADKDLVC
jgi:hypothetical protein